MVSPLSLVLRERGTDLHLNIQNDHLPLLPHVLNHLLARPISVSPKLRVFHETVFLNQILELLHGDIVVVNISLLSWPWIAGCVGDGSRKAIGVPCEEALAQCAFPDTRGAGDDDGARVCQRN
jgi:hypothetical protein